MFELFSIALHLFSSLHPSPVGGVGGNDAPSGDANGGTATGAKAGLEVTLPAAQPALLQAEQVELVAVLLAVPTEQ